jgi:hypothetical protein
MLIFHSEDAPLFLYAISRQKRKYQLVYAPAYGMASSREVAILNHTTPEDAALSLSANGRPLFWLDSDWDRENEPSISAPRGMHSLVLAAMPPVIVKTGRTRPMRERNGEEREAVEVELLLSEDQLSHQCWSCGHYETDVDIMWARMPRWFGEDDESLYCCARVSATELNAFST